MVLGHCSAFLNSGQQLISLHVGACSTVEMALGRKTGSELQEGKRSCPNQIIVLFLSSVRSLSVSNKCCYEVDHRKMHCDGVKLHTSSVSPELLTHDFLFHLYFLVQTDIPSIWIPHDLTTTLLMECIVWLKYLPCYNFLKLVCDTVSLKRPLVQLAKYPRAFVAADPQPWDCHFLIKTKNNFSKEITVNIGFCD